MKKIKSLLLIMALTAIWLLVGCSNNKDGSSQDNGQSPPKNEEQNSNIKESDLKLSDFFPLELGYTWEYEGEGNEYASFNRKVVFSNNNLHQIREDNGGTVAASVYNVSSSEITRVFFISESYGEENYLNSQPNEDITILKAPLEEGTKWEEEYGTLEIGSINETVSTPAGDFSDCIKVIITSENSIVNEYYKEGIGMVKREFMSGETKITSSLKKFSEL